MNFKSLSELSEPDSAASKQIFVSQLLRFSSIALTLNGDHDALPFPLPVYTFPRSLFFAEVYIEQMPESDSSPSE